MDPLFVYPRGSLYHQAAESPQSPGGFEEGSCCLPRSCLSPLLAFPWLLQELVLSFHPVKPEAQTQPADLAVTAFAL